MAKVSKVFLFLKEYAFLMQDIFKLIERQTITLINPGYCAFCYYGKGENRVVKA